jgi:hypothetical protein
VCEDSDSQGEQVYEIAEPSPSAMIESLRAVGYSLPTAIADLVANSISAAARNVWIIFEWNGSRSCVSIADDGHGMSEPELVTAMTLGSRSPLEERGANDLGRFGLGLKTASFSQCRRLIVRSKRSGGNAATRCWDLDYVGQQGEWRVFLNKGAKSLIGIFKEADLRPHTVNSRLPNFWTSQVANFWESPIQWNRPFAHPRNQILRAR